MYLELLEEYAEYYHDLANAWGEDSRAVIRKRMEEIETIFKELDING